MSSWVKAIASVLVLTGAYWVYARTVVPWIEPAAVVTKRAEPYFAPPTERYAERLATLFPVGSWERGNQAKIINSNEMLFILRDEPKPKNGKLHLDTCTLVYLPTGSADRVWKVQATGGVELEFDQLFDRRTANLGRLQNAFLPGRVRITGSPNTGAANGSLVTAGVSRDQDIIEIDTQNVQLTKQQITAHYEVDFRYGPSFGSGKDLRIDLQSVGDGSGDSGIGSGASQVRRIELVKLSELTFYPPVPRDAINKTVQPIKLECDGPVVFDVESGMAHVEKNVLIKRAGTGQTPDVLQCDRLTAYLNRLPKTTLGTAPSQEFAVGFPAMQLDRVLAEGSAVVTSWTGAANDLRWHRFESERLEYQFDPSGQVTPGGFRATGVGRYLSGVPTERFNQMEMRWRDALELDSAADGIVNLILTGDTACRIKQFGEVFAKRLTIAMKDSSNGSGDPRRAASASGSNLTSPTEFGDLKPNHIVAEEEVLIRTERLDAHVKRLDVAVKPKIALQPPVASASPLELGPPTGSAGSAGMGYTDVVEPKRKFAVEGDRLLINIFEEQGAYDLDDVVLEGHVRCFETSKDQSDSPVEMTGNRLRLTRLSETTGLAVVKGSPAVVRARKMAISGNNIHVDRDQSQIWIDGAGAATMPLPIQYAERFPNRPAVADVRWEGGLRFDGQSIQCFDGVLVQGPAQRLRSKQLVAQLVRPIDLTQSEIATEDVQLKTIVAEGGVQVENRNMDASGLLSIERAAVNRVDIDYQRQTVVGTGAGWIETVRRGSQIDEYRNRQSAPQGSGQRAAINPRVNVARPGDAGEQLYFLRVDFGRGFNGSMTNRTLTFRDQIRSVLGPVAQWDERLDANQGDLRPESASLTCQELTVFQVPGREGNPFELTATGNTRIDGKTPTGQIFSAQAQRLTFDPGKDQLLLQGDTRSEAELTYQRRVGGTRSKLSARNFLYGPKSNTYRLNGGSMLDFSDFGN